MKIIQPLLAILLVTTVFSCAPSSSLYKSENLSQTGFSNYKTYAFLPTTDTSYTKMFDKKKLETLMSAAAIKQLSKKGMTLDTANPDCFFTYRLIVNRNYEVSQEKNMVYNADVFTPAFDNDAKIYTFSSNNKPVVYAGRLNIDTLREGSMVIDMIDTKSGNVIWRSTYADKTEETYIQPTPDRVNEVIKKMFKKFPK